MPYQCSARYSNFVIKELGILLLMMAPALGADLSHATVVAGAELTGPERKAMGLLVDSVRERSRITWTVAAGNPGAGKAVVVVRQAARGGALAAEGYRLRTFDKDRKSTRLNSSHV